MSKYKDIHLRIWEYFRIRIDRQNDYKEQHDKNVSDDLLEIQKIIYKHEKLREYLIEEYEKISAIKRTLTSVITQDKAQNYLWGLRYALDYLDKEDDNA